MHHNGIAVEQSDKKSFEYSLKAAKKGLPEAQFLVAQEFEKATKYTEALEMVSKSGRAGFHSGPK